MMPGRHPFRTSVLRVALLLGAMVLAAACQSTSTDSPRTGKYVSESVTTSEADRGLFTDVSVQLRVGREDGATSFFLYVDCNNIDAVVQPQEGRLRVSELFVTELGCQPAERHRRDQWLVDLLASA